MSLFGARPGPVLVAVIMLVAALVNLYQFAEIDADTPPHLRALHALDSFDIVELGLKQGNIRATMNLYAVVGHEAPGVPLVVTSPELNKRGSEFRARMLGIGLVSGIDMCEIDSAEITLDPSIELQKGEVWKNPGDARRKTNGITWAFGKSATPPKRLVQLKISEFDILIVDEALVTPGGKLCP